MRHLKSLLWMVVVAGTVALLIYYPERLVLDAQVDPLPGTPRSQWIDDFMVAALNIGFWVSVVAVVLWYGIASFFTVVRWPQGRKRTWWALIGLLAVIVCFAVGFFMTERTRAGGQWAWAFYVLNPLLLYYFATALASPDAFKYTPLGARTVRKIRPRW